MLICLTVLLLIPGLSEKPLMSRFTMDTKELEDISIVDFTTVPRQWLVTEPTLPNNNDYRKDLSNRAAPATQWKNLPV